MNQLITRISMLGYEVQAHNNVYYIYCIPNLIVVSYLVDMILLHDPSLECAVSVDAGQEAREYCITF